MAHADPEPQDTVDLLVAQWAAVRPDLDVSPIEVIGRVSRLSRLVDRRLAEHFARFGLEAWMYDVLATLRRRGETASATPSELTAQTMVTTGAMTNRVDRLVERGLVERAHDPEDRRRVIVTLTPDGAELVDRVAEAHYPFESELLGALEGPELDRLAGMLRTLLLSLGDHPPSPADAR